MTTTMENLRPIGYGERLKMNGSSKTVQLTAFVFLVLDTATFGAIFGLGLQAFGQFAKPAVPIDSILIYPEPGSWLLAGFFVGMIFSGIIVPLQLRLFLRLNSGLRVRQEDLGTRASFAVFGFLTLLAIGFAGCLANYHTEFLPTEISFGGYFGGKRVQSYASISQLAYAEIIPCSGGFGKGACNVGESAFKIVFSDGWRWQIGSLRLGKEGLSRLMDQVSKLSGQLILNEGSTSVGSFRSL